MAVRILQTEDMEDRVLSLCEIMKNETEVCRELLDLSNAEQEYLIKSDIDSLARNTDRMKAVIENLKQSQASRHRYMDEIASEMDIAVDAMTIKTIRTLVKSDLSEKLHKTSRELMKIGERLYRANHNTVYLIDFSLELLDQQNRLWAELVSDKKEGYAEKGNKPGAHTYPLIVEKKV